MRCSIPAGLSYLAMLIVWVGSAAATPVDVFFNGPSTSMFPDTRFGMSEADATSARDGFGIDWVMPGTLGSVVSNYSVDSSLVLSFSPSPPTSMENRAREAWTVQNVSGGSFEGTSYLLFTQTTPFVKNGVSIEYTDENVGLTIDTVLGWVIVVHSSMSGTFYFPAIELDGITPNGAVSDPFDVEYVVNEPLVQAPASSGLFQLPQLVIARAFTPIPEPGAAALFAAGLALLGMRRRHRI